MEIHATANNSNKYEPKTESFWFIIYALTHINGYLVDYYAVFDVIFYILLRILTIVKFTSNFQHFSQKIIIR